MLRDRRLRILGCVERKQVDSVSPVAEASNSRGFVRLQEFR